MKEVYKVVGIHPNTKELTSIWVGAKYQTPFALRYALKEETAAPKGTAIFTFENLNSAREWVSYYFAKGEYQIYKCSGSVCRQQDKRYIDSSNLVYNPTVKTIKDLIANLKVWYKKPIKGTIFCSRITLLQRVE